MVITREQMAAVFDEWARCYKKNPGGFEPSDSETNFTGYGERCAMYFEKIMGDLKNSELKRTPPPPA